MKNLLAWAFIGITFGALILFATIGALTLWFADQGVIQCHLIKEQSK